MFRFINKKMFFGLSHLGGLLISDGTKCVSLKDQPWQNRPAIVHINSNEPLCYPFPVSIKR